MKKEFIGELIKQAVLGNKKNEIPVGCIIAEKNQIISKAYNRTEKSRNPIKHAEIIAIEKACKKKKSKNLNGCVIYTTIEPCVMCAGAIAQAKISKIIYLLENDKFGFTKHLKCPEIIMNHKLKIEKLEDNEQIAEMLKNFFKNKR